jgi:4-hydroxybenzoyl-CoA thioesterase
MFVSRRTIRIEWGDCDAAGIVYFPRYVEYFDACTAHMFEAAGYPKQQMLKTFEMAGFPMVDLKMRFLIPSTFGDDVVVESQVTEWKRSSFVIKHQLFRGTDLAVEGQETRVWTKYDEENPGRLKSMPIPDEVKARFEQAS